MEIKVRMIKENKDGSALAEVDFDKKGWETLVQWGLVAMLTKAVSEYAPRPEDLEDDTKPAKKSKKKKELDMDGRC